MSERAKQKKQIEQLMEEYGVPKQPPKVDATASLGKIPSLKQVVQNMRVRARKRNAKILEKPKPSRIDQTIQEYTDHVDKRGLRGNQPGVAPVVDGYDILARISEEVTHRKTSRR